jgi:hypothetical protein
LKVEELPFLKRYAYEHESEFRVVFDSEKKKVGKIDIDVPLSSIERITLSPWMHYDLYVHTKALLRTLPGVSRIKILRSTLIGNQEWKAYGDSAV